MESAARRTGPARERDRYRVIVRNDLQAALACFQLYFTPRGRAITKIASAASRLRQGYGERRETAAGCSCNAGSVSRSHKYCTICSTKAVCGRGKINKYFGPFSPAGKMTRFSERNFGSRVTTEPSKSIVRANGRPLLRATKMILCGFSFVATSAPKRFAGMRRPRPLTHGAAQAIVSPRIFSRLKTGASRGGGLIGNFTGTLRSAGPFNFFQASQIFAFMARKILGAK